MPAARRPKLPDGLEGKAALLWTRTTRAYTFRPDELEILEQACREVKMIERLEQAIDRLDNLEVVGSMGQPVMSPYVAEIRQHRNVLARLLTALKLPDDPAVAAGRAAAVSTQARGAANARWGSSGKAG